MLPRGGGRLERGARVIKPGEEWGRPTTANADVECHGNDQALAALITADSSPPLVRWSPVDSDFARSVGLHPNHTMSRTGGGGIELPVDALAFVLASFPGTSDGRVTHVWGINAAVLGVAPTKLSRFHRQHPVTVVVDGRTVFTGNATTVVIANGQYLDGCDLVPRGHPGDGRVEIQVYALTPGERTPMRRRLPSGTHLPHPRITTTSGRTIEVTTGDRAWPLMVDGEPGTSVHRLGAAVRSPAVRLLI